MKLSSFFVVHSRENVLESVIDRAKHCAQEAVVTLSHRPP